MFATIFMRKLLIILFILCISFSLHAQKVGVVLSGGGAKGLYHIGILKALEENNIPIDYISGTSMGAIIAGLYAAGYSADDMIYFFTNDNIAGWVSGKIEDKYVFYYSQDEVRPSLFSTNIDLKSIIRTQKANKENPDSKSMFAGTTTSALASTTILPSTQLDVELMGYFASANAKSKGNFDNLFVPFRCVASDVVKKEQYVWKEGDLATAIRSSMAIPIVFSPILKDSMVLYDGGVYNNFPWRDMDQEFKPDFIIGGRCVAGNSPNIHTLTGQIELMVMQTTDYTIPKESGLVIGRNVDVSVLDFSSPLTTIEQGYSDAIEMMDSIRKKITRRTPQEEVEKRRLKYKSSLPVLEFSGRSVESLDNIKVPTRKERSLTADTLFIDTSRPRNKGKLTNDSYSFAAFKSIFYRTMLDREMKSGFPKANFNPETGLFDLEVKMSSVPIFKLRGGLNISSSSINQAYLGVIFQDNRRNRGVYAVDGYLGSFYNSTVISTRHNFYERETPFYLKNSITYNYTDYARANNQKITFNSLFKEGNYVSNEIYWSSILGVKVSRDGKAEIRFATGNESIKFSDKNLGTDIAPNERGNVYYATLGGSISRNKLNYEVYPTRGSRQSLSLSATYGRIKITSPVDGEPYGTETSYLKRETWLGASFSREDYFHLTRWFTLGYSAEATWANLPDMGNDYINRAFSPRFTPTTFSRTLFLPEFQGNSYIAGGIMPIFELNEKLYLRAGVFVYKPDILKYKNFDDKLKYITDVTAVFQTPIGPLSFSYNNFSVSSTRRNYWIFSFGYMIFNKRGVVY